MKGLTPVIAIILLIVISVSAFVIYKSWYISYKEQQISKEEYILKKEIKKFLSSIRIYYVDLNNSRIYVINDGYRNLTEVKLYAINTSGEFLIGERDLLEPRTVWVVSYNLTNVSMLYVTCREGVYDKYEIR